MTEQLVLEGSTPLELARWLWEHQAYRKLVRKYTCARLNTFLTPETPTREQVARAQLLIKLGLLVISQPLGKLEVDTHQAAVRQAVDQGVKQGWLKVTQQDPCEVQATRDLNPTVCLSAVLLADLNTYTDAGLHRLSRKHEREVAHAYHPAHEVPIHKYRVTGVASGVFGGLLALVAPTVQLVVEDPQTVPEVTDFYSVAGITWSNESAVVPADSNTGFATGSTTGED